MIRFEDVSVIYNHKKEPVYALNQINLRVNQGEFIVLRGPSGSGKTTLLMSTGAMLRPTEGNILIDDTNLYDLPIAQRAVFRAQNIGFVFQMFHLVNYLSVLENVMMAAHNKNSETEQKAKAMLEKLGLAPRLKHKPSELSAGEKQRTAIARALFNNPKIVLADEPTGNLDPENAAEVMEHLSQYHKNGGTVLVVTHGTVANDCADRILKIRDGKLEHSE